MIILKGMTWDHERGYAPLLALTKRFNESYPEVNIEWDRRSLKDFGDYPVTLLAQAYDLILIDHPHVGVCADQNVLIKLDQFIPQPYLQEQTENAVGLSHRSYQWQNHQYALAVDAAAQVSTYRPDMLHADSLPTTWKQVIELAKSLPSNRKVGWSLCPTDAICSFLTLCAGIGGEHFFDETNGISVDVGAAAISRMLELLPYLHESSLSTNPIQMYDQMVRSNEIIYVPLAFGYTNYARAVYGKEQLRFSNIPSSSGKPKGSLLGGVGIAVSQYSKQIPLAVEFAMLTADPNMQRTLYFESGGQPGHAAAWRDEEVNQRCGGFFVNTLETLQHSYMRPRNQAFPEFQEKSGILLHDVLSRRQAGERVSEAETIKRMNSLYQQLVEKFK